MTSPFNITCTKYGWILGLWLGLRTFRTSKFMPRFNKNQGSLSTIRHIKVANTCLLPKYIPIPIKQCITNHV